MAERRVSIPMPELGLDEVPGYASVWHIRLGSPVTIGQPLLEVVAGEVLFDLPAPASGILVEKLVQEDESVVPGQRVGTIAVVSPEEDS